MASSRLTASQRAIATGASSALRAVVKLLRRDLRNYRRAKNECADRSNWVGAYANECRGDAIKLALAAFVPAPTARAGKATKTKQPKERT